MRAVLVLALGGRDIDLGQPHDLVRPARLVLLEPVEHGVELTWRGLDGLGQGEEAGVGSGHPKGVDPGQVLVAQDVEDEFASGMEKLRRLAQNAARARRQPFFPTGRSPAVYPPA